MADDKIQNFATRYSVVEDVEGMFESIEASFKERKQDQIDDIEEYWKIYQCVLTDQQIYDGDSQVFTPIVRDAVDARAKRFTGMLFPTVGQTVGVVSESGDTPWATIALLQRHVQFAKLRNRLPPIFKNGDVEGQWSVMVDWVRREHKVTRKFTDTTIPGFDYEDVKTENVIEEGPEITIVAAQDLSVWPPTVADIQDGEIVTVKLRWTKEKLKQKAKEGLLVQSLVDEQLQMNTMDAGDKWAGKSRSEETGVKVQKTKFMLVYQVYTKLKLEGKKKVPAIAFITGAGKVLGVIKNPYWSQKINILSLSQDEVAGSFWGMPKVKPVADLQYQLNDVVNMGLDSALYALLPIIMTDPLKNPRVASMIMGKAAIWETSPNDTKIVNFPPLYEKALELKNDIKAQVMESMEVNETMLGKAPAGRKNAQAIAQQSSEAMATINDTVKRFETGMCDPLLEWFFELDLQFREDDLLVLKEGPHGQQATVERIPPQQFNERYFFKWQGTDQVMGPQRIQQLLSLFNLLRSIPPQQLNGRKVDLGPIIDQLVQLGFGPTLSGQILIDQRHQMTVDPHIENQMLHNGFDVPTSPMDDDQKHLQVHEQEAHATKDPTGSMRRHMMAHVAQVQARAAQQQPQPGMPGAPGGAAPGVAGAPKPGAQPAPQRNMQAPPGAVHSDQMQDPQAGMRG